jgi:hypothetical protein
LSFFFTLYFYGGEASEPMRCDKEQADRFQWLRSYHQPTAEV